MVQQKIQTKQKQWYDQRAREQQITVGDQVLLLLPDQTMEGGVHIKWKENLEMLIMRSLWMPLRYSMWTTTTIMRNPNPTKTYIVQTDTIRRWSGSCVEQRSRRCLESKTAGSWKAILYYWKGVPSCSTWNQSLQNRSIGKAIYSTNRPLSEHCSGYNSSRTRMLNSLDGVYLYIRTHLLSNTPIEADQSDCNNTPNDLRV